MSVTPLGGSFGVAVANEFYTAAAVILAVGITRERLYPGEAELLGRGVSYCATCDGMLYRGKTVAVIGSSAEAKEDAAFLEGIGCRVLRFEDLQEMRISSIVDLKDSMRAVTRWYLQDNSILRRFPTR